MDNNLDDESEESEVDSNLDENERLELMDKKRREREEEDEGPKITIPKRMVISIPQIPKRLFNLFIQLYQAMDLPAADIEGTSDPYCVISFGRNMTQTQAAQGRGSSIGQ
eukprot:gene27772-34292_t